MMDAAIAARFPLVCRAKPCGGPHQRVQDVLDTAADGASHLEKVTNASAVINMAAHVASDVGLCDWAFQMCQDRYAIFADGDVRDLADRAQDTSQQVTRLRDAVVEAARSDVYAARAAQSALADTDPELRQTVTEGGLGRRTIPAALMDALTASVANAEARLRTLLTRGMN